MQAMGIWDRIGAKVEVRRKRPRTAPGGHRYDYQTKLVEFGIRPGMRVLDIGSGGDPFPSATVLVERYVQPKFRTESLVTNDVPLVVADIHQLPFRAGSFDFIYSAHVLEVIDDPLTACREIMRVGRRGYIETPTFAKDMLFAWARNYQKWHVIAVGSCLCFFEYSDRQLSGIGSTVWRELIFDKWRHPLQDAFWGNQDVFNVMFPWEGQFGVMVYHLDGRIRALHAAVENVAAETETASVHGQ